MTSFFVKADPELQRMVKDFYDSDFNESSADDRPEMSQGTGEESGLEGRSLRNSVAFEGL